MKKFFFDRRYSGIIWTVIISGIFWGLSQVERQFFFGAKWFLFNSLLRFVFGIVVLVVGKWLYGKNVKKILNFDNSKAAVTAGIGFIIYFIYYLVLVGLGMKTITGLTAGLLISRIFLQQITTGFYEELNYRFLVLEGYFHGNRCVKNRLIYAFISFIIFGLMHVTTGWNTYTFLLTGTIGFALATMYLKSENVVIPIIFHFVYDIVANLTDYIDWNEAIYMKVNSVFEIMIVIMFIISLAVLIKKEKPVSEV